MGILMCYLGDFYWEEWGYIFMRELAGFLKGLLGKWGIYGLRD